MSWDVSSDVSDSPSGGAWNISKIPVYVLELRKNRETGVYDQNLVKFDEYDPDTPIKQVVVDVARRYNVDKDIDVYGVENGHMRGVLMSEKDDPISKFTKLQISVVIPSG